MRERGGAVLCDGGKKKETPRLSQKRYGENSMKQVQEAWAKVKEIAGCKPLLSDRERLDALVLAMKKLADRIEELESRPYGFSVGTFPTTPWIVDAAPPPPKPFLDDGSTGDAPPPIPPVIITCGGEAHDAES